MRYVARRPDAPTRTALLCRQSPSRSLMPATMWHAVRGADLAQRPDGRAVIGILGGALRLGLVAEDVAARRQLREHDEVRTLLGGGRRPAHGLRAVVLELADVRLVLGDGDADRAAHTLTVAQQA